MLGDLEVFKLFDKRRLSVRSLVGPKALYMPISDVVRLFNRYSGCKCIVRARSPTVIRGSNCLTQMFSVGPYEVNHRVVKLLDRYPAYKWVKSPMIRDIIVCDIFGKGIVRAKGPR